MTERWAILLEQLLGASDADEVVGIIGRDPQLLSDEANAAIAGLAADARASGASTADRIRAFSVFLQRCRAVGVHAAVEETQRRQGALRTTELAVLFDHALASYRSFERSGSVSQLRAAVDVSNELMRHPDFGAESSDFRVDIISNSSVMLMQLYAVAGNIDDLDSALHLLAIALAAVSPGSPTELSILTNMGAGLLQRYDRTTEPADLDRACISLERAVDGSAPDDPERPGRLSNLGVALTRRYEDTGNAADLSRSLFILEEVLAAAASEDPERPGFLKNFADALLARYEHSGSPEDLNSVVGSLSDVVAQTPLGHPERAAYLSAFGDALDLLYQLTGDPADLERAITTHQESLAEIGGNAPGHALALNSLGNSLRSRYYYVGDLDDLETALAAYTRAVDESPPSSSQRLTFLQNLAIAFSDHYARSGSIDALAAGIDAAQQAFDGTPPTAPERGRRARNLAMVLLNLYQQNGEPAVVERAIDLVQQETSAALNPTDRAIAVNLLAGAHTARFRRSGNPKDLSQAVGYYDEACAALPSGSPRRALFLSNLASALRHQYDITADPAIIPRAVQLSREACRQGLQGEIEWGLVTSAGWGEWASRRGSWAEAAEAYALGMVALQNLFRTQLTREHKEVWLSDAQAIPAPGAYAMARAGELSTAVTTLELGRALLLSEALEDDRVDLTNLDVLGKHQLAERYRGLADRVIYLERAQRAAFRSERLAEASP